MPGLTNKTPPAVELTRIVRMILVTNDSVKFLCSDRVFHQIADQGMTQAHLIVSRESTERPRTMSGGSDYARGVIRVEAYTPVRDDLSQLVRAVAAALDDPTSDPAVVSAARSRGIAIGFLELDDESDVSIQPPAGQAGPPMRGVMMTFRYLVTKPA